MERKARKWDQKGRKQQVEKESGYLKTCQGHRRRIEILSLKESKWEWTKTLGDQVGIDQVSRIKIVEKTYKSYMDQAKRENKESYADILSKWDFSLVTCIVNVIHTFFVSFWHNLEYILWNFVDLYCNGSVLEII